MYNSDELTDKVHLLKKLKRDAEDLESQIKNLENELKSEMEEKGVSELTGEDWKITWNYVNSNRFDQSAFKTIHPDLFESFKVATSSRRFLLS